MLEDGGVKAECVITDEGGGILELKNLAVEPDLAVEPEAQRKGYGKALIDFLVRKYAGHYALLQVGTAADRAVLRKMRIYPLPPHPKLLHRSL